MAGVGYCAPLWMVIGDLNQQLHWTAFISVVYLPLAFGIASGFKLELPVYTDIFLWISILSFYMVSTDAEHLMIHLRLRMWYLHSFQLNQTSDSSILWKCKLGHITYLPTSVFSFGEFALIILDINIK